jgi:cysteinyl-tRNA synthetase
MPTKDGEKACVTDGKAELRLYNTLTRTKEVFTPIDPDNVRMYVCGPTVYDFAHIGNARPVIVFDVLFRLLRHLYGEDHVTYVRNITDVDDKINARALRDFPDLPLNEAIRNVTEKTASQFHADVAALGCLEPTFEPRATEFVLPRPDGKTDMVGLIQSLIDSKHAYEAKGESGREILFDTTSMPQYGQLSKRNLDEQQAGARVAVEAHKKHPADFVLWKESSADEPGWDATFRVGGKDVAIRGRPGWHIECSAMSAAYLGEVFDIHGGGLDLIFPHHENEIAQSRCAHGTDVMANVWMHNGYLQVEGRKMSKSEGNFVTIHDLLHTEKFGGQRWHGRVLRLAKLMTQYRQPIDFSADRLFEAREILYAWNMDAYEAPVRQVPSEVVDALLDDVATPNAISAIHALGREVRKRQTGSQLAESAGRLRAALELLGLYHEGQSMELLTQDVRDRDVDERVQSAINHRLSLIREKNWAEADRIRDELLAQGIQLKDGKDPETGERVTTWEVKR